MQDKNDAYWQSLLRKHVHGRLSEEERFALEKRALDDPFLFDAIEGLSQQAVSERSEAISELSARLAKQTSRRRRRLTWFYRAAAVALLLVMAIGIGYYVTDSERAQMADVSSEADDVGFEESVVADALDSTFSESTPAMRRETETVAPQQPPRTKISTPAMPNEPVPERPARSQQHEEASDHESELSVLDTDTMGDIAIEVRAAEPALIESTERIEGDRKRTPSAATQRSDDFANLDLNDYKEAAFLRISGLISDSETKTAVPNARISIAGTDIATSSDTNGKYQINVPYMHPSLLISHPEYTTQEIRIGGKTSIDVDLLSHEMAAQSAEEQLAATKMEIAHTEVQIRPVLGWYGLEKHLEAGLDQQRKLGAAPQADGIAQDYMGEITVQFTITEYGTLRDFRVVQSNCGDCDATIIRLLKTAGTWITEPPREEVRTDLTIFL